MKQYILKDGEKVQAIPVGRSSVKIGEISPEGMLVVCDRGPNNTKNRGAMVICQCKCGKYTLISLNSLRNNHIKSCGCYNKEYHKQICKKIGQQSYFKDYSKDNSNPYYKFIKRLDKKNNYNSAFWEIECRFCGKRYEAVPVQLISYTRRGYNPCDCLRFQSKGVIKIQKILKENNILFETEKSFQNCISPKGNLLKFDFWVNNNYLIEYDGEQHFTPQSFGGKRSGEERLKEYQLYDKIKNDWCKDNNIILIRIPYTHLINITINDLLPNSSNFIINDQEKDNE